MDDSEFIEWVAGHQRQLLRSAYLLTGDKHRAQDLVQEALVKVALRWPRLRTGNPTAYARTIFVHDHVSWWRRHRREVATADTAEAAPAVSDAEAVLVVRRALARLTPRQRAVLQLAPARAATRARRDLGRDRRDGDVARRRPGRAPVDGDGRRDRGRRRGGFVDADRVRHRRPPRIGPGSGRRRDRVRDGGRGSGHPRGRGRLRVPELRCRRARASLAPRCLGGPCGRDGQRHPALRPADRPRGRHRARPPRRVRRYGVPADRPHPVQPRAGDRLRGVDGLAPLGWIDDSTVLLSWAPALGRPWSLVAWDVDSGGLSLLSEGGSTTRPLGVARDLVRD